MAEMPRLLRPSVAEQAGLSPAQSHISEDRFSYDAAQILKVKH